jgi:hypothetical protein
VGAVRRPSEERTDVKRLTLLLAVLALLVGPVTAASAMAQADASSFGDCLSGPKGPLRLPASETWGRLDTLDDHFLRHGAGVGARTADEYAGMSSEFFQRGLRDGLPTKIDADGIIRIYDPATNTFGAFNPSGTTRTFFTPKRGIDYWYDQPGSDPWGPGR